MSRSADFSTPPRAPRDGGFSLLEMIVAIGIIMIVVTALLPQLIVGIRATATARTITQAKGVAQGQLERMRNLPFHISPAAGDYRDVLDFYYRNDDAPATAPVCTSGGGDYADPQVGWTGYVPDGGVRCDYEPPTGALYRYVLPEQVQGFRVVVSTQFLAGTLPAGGGPPAVIAPPSGYDTQETGKDRPPASQLGVTVTVLTIERGRVKPVTAYTQIAEQPSSVSRIKVNTTATALEVGSVSKADGAVSLSAGLLNLVGSLTYASTAGANLASTSAGLATGSQNSGASTSLSVPPNITTVNARTSAAGELTSDGCLLVCWGPTRVDEGPITSAGGLPNVGSATWPMQALLTEKTLMDGSTDGFVFHNSAAVDYRPSLLLDGPLVRMHRASAAQATGVTSSCQPGTTGAAAYVASSGFIRTTALDHATEGPTAEACAVTRATTVAIMPTKFAPRGIVQVELTRASARCKVSGTTHVPTAEHDYHAVVRYRDPSSDNGYSVAGTIIPGLSSDPLDEDLLTSPVGEGRQLGDYIESWSALLGSEVVPTVSGGLAAVTLPGVVTITTRPVRLGIDEEVPAAGRADGSEQTETVDLSSVVSLTFGAVGCSSEDGR